MIAALLTRGPAVLALALAPATQEPAPPGLASLSAPDRARALALEERLLESISAGHLRALHTLLASEPHDAGTPGDARQIERMVHHFEALGLEVEVHELHLLLARPISAALELVAPERRVLPTSERALEADPDTSHPDLRPGWNAYSGSGTVEGEVVYANQGRKEDFERLAELGVDCAGKVVVARYGGNFRGYKAKFAEAAGAAGLVIYTDPRDAGYTRGLPYPEGGYANESTIQRGSILTLPWTGDPQTPFVEATADAPRLPLEELALPRIPVQPVGWKAAAEILRRMDGASVPQAWQGGLPFRYRLTGGPELRVKLTVEQERAVLRTANVIATLRGAERPDELVLIGSHHDAWGFGAADPTCGLICVLEAARAFAEAAADGLVPRRSIAFCAWGAEEFGILGSSEFVESRLDELRRSAVCYLNLDMAVTGPNVSSSASPSVQRAIAAAAARVPQAREPERDVLSVWRARGANASDDSLPAFGDLGGGSDHVAFLALAGVPCASLNAGGAAGTSYHSNYDTLRWYRQVVGEDYEPARMVAELCALTAARFADLPVAPLDPARAGAETRRHVQALARRAADAFEDGDRERVRAGLARVERAAADFEARATLVASALAGSVGDEQRARVDAALRALDRAWLDEQGLPGRPWFRNLFASTDESSGYASWMLPALRHAIEHEDVEAFAAAERRTLAVFVRLDAQLAALVEALD